MSDQVEGMIRDSDIKFECRVLLKIIEIMKLPIELENELIRPIEKIVKLENQRLDRLAND